MKVKLKNYLQFVMLLLFLLTLAITLTINARWLYVIDVHSLEITKIVDLSYSNLMKNYDELMQYLNFFWINSLKLSDFSSSVNGLLHFKEVKNLFQLNYLILLLTSLPSFYYIGQLYRQKRIWTLIKPLTAVLVVLLSLVATMAVAFNQFFIWFHELFFNNDAWMFDPLTDPIINALPQDYFLHCFILFFSVFILFCFLFIRLGKRQLKKDITV
ncbi:MAG: TIGR01906 family membrane protein [Vagococcus sp.]